MNQAKIGERIRYIRDNNLKLSREQLAEKLNTNVYAIDRLERGEFKTLNMNLIIEFCNLSGVTIDEIIREPIDETKNNIIKRINYMLQDLPEKELDYIFKNIHNFIEYKKNLDTDI